MENDSIIYEVLATAVLLEDLLVTLRELVHTCTLWKTKNSSSESLYSMEY